MILGEDMHPPQLGQLLAGLDRVFARKEGGFIEGSLPLIGAGRTPGQVEVFGHSDQRLGSQDVYKRQVLYHGIDFEYVLAVTGHSLPIANRFQRRPRWVGIPEKG